MGELVMLAETYKNQNVNGWWWSEKFDGVRGVWKASEKKMYTRKNNEIELPDFLFEQLNNINIDLDGEIWFGYDTFDLCSGQVRKEDRNLDSWKNMKYLVFDVMDAKLVFEDRIDILFKELYISNKPKYDNIEGVKYKKVKEDTDLLVIREEIENKKGEGVILRAPKSPYEFKRSKLLLKFKSWDTCEATIYGYLPGKGRLEDKVGTLLIKNEDFGNFKVGTGLSDLLRESLDNEERVKMKKDNPDIPVFGDVITIRYRDTTKNGMPKFLAYVGIRDYE